MPDIEHIYMSEKNSNHVKEIDDNKKCANVGSGKRAKKVGGKIHEN